MGEFRVFFKEFRQTFRTTGSIIPSSPAVARAMAREVRRLPSPRRVLEVGSGTGACTRELLELLGPEDTLDLVELNENFAGHLRHRLQTDPKWKRASVPWELHVGDVLEIDLEPGFDVVVSSLPFNNFEPQLVQRLIDRSISLLRPGGVYSFFEYFAIRRLKMCVVNQRERRRLRTIGRVIRHYHRESTASTRKLVIANLPPVLTHHIRVPNAEGAQASSVVRSLQ